MEWMKERSGAGLRTPGSYSVCAFVRVSSDVASRFRQLAPLPCHGEQLPYIWPGAGVPFSFSQSLSLSFLFFALVN